MGKAFYLLAALFALGLAGPAQSNFVREATFDEKIALSTLVVIGTVTAVDRTGRDGPGLNATVAVATRLKGESGATINVSTYSRIAEMDPRCCDLGATYLMFLRPVGDGPQYASVWGAGGMVRVGGPPNENRGARFDQGR